MPEDHLPPFVQAPNPWPLVLALVGVDYFSTLAYLPSIAVEAAGPFAPIAAGVVVLVTFLLALPVYWYIVGRSYDGRGATGMLEDLTPGWRGKLVVLTLLGFAAADFVITRSLSLADAAVHLIHNPHGQRLLAQLPTNFFGDDSTLWQPLAKVLHRLFEPQVAITLGLSVISFVVWQLFKRGVARRILLVLAAAVSCYLALSALVIASALLEIARHPTAWHAWLDTVFLARPPVGAALPPSPHAWLWAWLAAVLWSFPQMALGLSGFEMIMNVVPRVSGGSSHESGTLAGRIRNTRKLMVVAASIMAVYLVSAVVVTTLAVPRAELLPGGAAEHRALAYLAHGSPLAEDLGGTPLSSIFGEGFGDLYDLSATIILCLAGASVTMGLHNLLPHYLNRLGMEVNWAGKISVIVHLLNVIVLLVTIVFRASPASQQWAYATSVLVLLAGGSLAAAKDLARHAKRGPSRPLLVTLSALAGGFFLAMTGLTVLINHSGLTIAMAFVAAILVSSFVSRWIRSTELRFEGFEFADERQRAPLERTLPLRPQGPRAPPPRPGHPRRPKSGPATRLSPRPCHARDLHRRHARRPQQLLPQAADEDRARRRARGDPRLALREHLPRAGRHLPRNVPRRRLPTGNHLRLVPRTAARRQPELPAPRRRQHPLDGQRTSPPRHTPTRPPTTYSHRLSPLSLSLRYRKDPRPRRCRAPFLAWPKIVLELTSQFVMVY